jgi:hypothetical protein
MCVTFAINEQGGGDSEESYWLLQVIRGVAPITPVPSTARNRAEWFFSLVSGSFAETLKSL